MGVPKYQEYVKKKEQPEEMVSKVADLKKLAPGDIIARYGKDGKLIDAYHIKGKDDEGRYIVGIWDKKTGKYTYKSDDRAIYKSENYYAEVSSDGKRIQIWDNRATWPDGKIGKPIQAAEVYVQLRGGKKAEAPEEKKAVAAKQAAPQAKEAPKKGERPAHVGGGKKVFSKTELDSDAEYYSNYLQKLDADDIANGEAKLKYGAGWRKQDLMAELSDGEREWLAENIEGAAKELKEIIAGKRKGAGEAGFRAFREWIAEKAGERPAKEPEKAEEKGAGKREKEAPAEKEKKGEKPVEKEKPAEKAPAQAEKKEAKVEEKKPEEHKVEARKPVLMNREISSDLGPMTIQDYIDKKVQEIQRGVDNDDGLVVRERDRSFSFWDLLIVPAVWKYGLSYISDAIFGAPVNEEKTKENRDAEKLKRVREFTDVQLVQVLRANGIGRAEDGKLYELEAAPEAAGPKEAPRQRSRADEIVE